MSSNNSSNNNNNNSNNKPRGRSAYSSLPLSSEIDTFEELEDADLDDDGDRRPIRDTPPLSLERDGAPQPPPPLTTGNSSLPLPSLPSRRNGRSYQRVAVAEDPDGTAVPTSSETQNLTSSASAQNNNKNNESKMMMDPLTAAAKAQEDLISIVVLDPAQHKFRVSVHADWNVLEFKRVGEAVHKVPPSSQRLIFRGKMLTDDKTLREFGIVEADAIVHLFPKPKVVVASSNNNNDNTTQQQQQQQASEEGGSNGGAHITRIVLDPREAEQRSSILVLGSEEVMEAQNNVKLFSFMLLIICSMELLALFTLMLGEPDDGNSRGGRSPYYPHNHTSIFDDAIDPNSPYPYASSDETFEPRTWQNTDYIDLVISAVGFYVATLGIKATTENTLALARQYLIGTVVVGIAWNAFYFVLNIQAEEKIAQENHQVPSPASDFVTQALFAILLPGAVWILCCMRAWQFHNLLQEAEQEAAERIRGELVDGNGQQQQQDLEQGGGEGSGSSTAGATTSSNNESSGLSLPHRNITLL